MTRVEDEVSVDSIAAGGDGVARRDGLVIFIPRSAPGDRLRVSYKKGGRFARGDVRSVVQSAPSRIQPPCGHYVMDRCGGCQLQHMAYDAQLTAKSGIIRDSLTRIGRRAVEAPSVTPSPDQWRYRRKLTLAMRRKGATWIAGLHPYDDPDAVFDLVDCPITEERVVAIWRSVIAASAHFPDTDRLRGAVRLLGSGASFVLEGGRQWRSWEAFLAAVPEIRALWWAPEEGSRRQLADLGDDRAGASFAQVNVGMAARLHHRVIERTMARSPRTVVDAYAGTGATAAGIAARGVAVVAIESDRDAARQCASVLASPSRAIAGLVERELAATLPADVLIVNPPRTGLDAAVPDIVSTSRPPVIIYVSCNPATLARDLARMPDYRISAIEAFDMFPQTAHVETLCELEAT